ncbi:hypothetical protein BS17DRAFT_818312 [Gyrodon lividus]|nr:hypothetical protein BS17DRAFT_818312 [Gyrodon lividus]
MEQEEEISDPTLLLDQTGVILAWYLPGVLSEEFQWDCSRNLELLFLDLSRSCTLFEGEITGAIKLSLAWYQQGRVPFRHRPEVLALLKDFHGDSGPWEWLGASSLQTVVLLAALLVMHPDLYASGREALLKLAKSNEDTEMGLSSPSEAVEKEFPWYSDLHGLWKGIPSYTPKSIVNSTPGVSRGTQLLTLVQPKNSPVASSSSQTILSAPTVPSTLLSGPTALLFGSTVPSGPPPSGPPSLPSGPSALTVPTGTPTSSSAELCSRGGQEKGKQHAEAPIKPDVDMNLDDFEGNYNMNEDPEPEVESARGHKHSALAPSPSPPPLLAFAYPRKDAMPEIDNRSAFHFGFPASQASSGSCGHQSRCTPNPSYHRSSVTSSASTRAPFSSTSESPVTSQSTMFKCSKTVVLTRDSIEEILDKGMAAINDDKNQSSSAKLARLRLKLDHACFADEHAFEREQCNSELANAAIVHQRLQKVVESQIRLKQAESKDVEKHEEVRRKLEEEARRKAEEDERKQKAEAEVARVVAKRLRQGSQESQRRGASGSLKGSEVGPSQGQYSLRGLREGGGAVSGSQDRTVEDVCEVHAGTLVVPGGQSRERQKSPEARGESEGEDKEGKEDEEDEEHQDALGALLESYEAQRQANEAYQGAVMAQLLGIQQVLLDGLAAFLVSQGSRFGESGEGWGVSEWKGKERDEGQGGQGTDAEDGDEEEDEGEEGGEEDGDGDVV